MSTKKKKTASDVTTAVKKTLPTNDDLLLHTYTEDAYLRYAMATVLDRALPQIQDGQKPVQKRILYSMRGLGLSFDAKPVKSARIVGDVIGRLHPHGDTAVYDALVRMSQDFTLRYPIIQGQGNFGSRDGDPAAAYRYCFAAGTRVSTEEGLLPIEQLPWAAGHTPPSAILTERTEMPLNLGVATRDGEMLPAAFWVNSGYQDTVTVTTRRDYAVRCTPNEPFLVLDVRGPLVWRNAEDLRPGDLLVLRRKPARLADGQQPLVPGWPAGQAMAELAGFISGGLEAVGGRHTYELAIPSPRAAQRFTALVRALLPTVRISFRSPQLPALVRLEGQALTRLVAGLYPAGTVEPLPPAIFRAKPLDVTYFLQGLAEAAGGRRQRGRVGYLEFRLPSRAAAEDLKTLLLSSLGFVSGRIRERRGQFVLRTGGAETMGRYQAALISAHILGVKLGRPANERPIDPHFRLEDHLARLPGNTAVAARKALAPAPVEAPAYSAASREALLGDYFFEPVRAVTPAEPTFVYDLTVPKTHAFTANGFVVHNTECRLAAFADVLLAETHRGTVGFKPNFDNTAEEPAVLPARLPVLLLNGSKGIAVGMANNIPPHQIEEIGVAVRRLLEKPGVSDDELYACVPGPDFPDGGQITATPEEIRAAYETGRGSLRMRARYRVEELARGQWQVVVYEMPYQVSTKQVLLEIEKVCNPQAGRNAKSITQSQATLKQVALTLLEKATDESGKDAFVRLVISPRSAKQNPDELMAFLFAHTSLQSTFGVNLTFIGLDGSPQTRGLASMLRQWTEFRVDTVRKRVTFDLDKVEKRIHILEGRMIVFLNVDQVIQVIRESDEPKADLMARFGLSEVQAEDILEIRLRQLARLEGIRIEKELKDARAEAATLRGYLASDKALRKLVLTEFTADVARYATPRRTLIQPEDKAEKKALVAKTVVDEPITVLLSRNLWIRARNGHDVDSATATWKAGDTELVILKTRTTQTVFFLDSKGRVYSVDGAAIPANRGDGVPLSTLIEPQDGARILYAFAGEPDQEWLFAGELGYGFRAALKALVARPRAGKAFLTLQEGESPLRPWAIGPETGYVACGSTDGRLLVFPVAEVKVLDKGKGVKLLDLADDARVSALHVGSGEPWTLPVTGGKSPQVILKGEDWAKYCMHRGRRGYQLAKKAVLATG